MVFYLAENVLLHITLGKRCVNAAIIRTISFMIVMEVVELKFVNDGMILINF